MQNIPFAHHKAQIHPKGLSLNGWSVAIHLSDLRSSVNDVVFLKQKLLKTPHEDSPIHAMGISLVVPRWKDTDDQTYFFGVQKLVSVVRGQWKFKHTSKHILEIILQN